MDLLCSFARRFPDLAADLLHRDRHKRRNFREETITDVLIAGLTAFEALGVRVDFPADESKTGEDMDWEFVAPRALDGRRYLRLHIQAKRAIKSSSKRKPYWFYRELDHAVPRGAQWGTQHKLLVNSARATPGCVPLYMFYHPRDALAGNVGKIPAIEGVNVMFADKIRKPVSAKHWPVADKKVERWRRHFMSLSDLLCFGHGSTVAGHLPGGLIAFLIFAGQGLVSPGELADRLNELRDESREGDVPEVQAIEEIPQSTLNAIDVDSGTRRISELARPRIIFQS